MEVTVWPTSMNTPARTRRAWQPQRARPAQGSGWRQRTFRGQQQRVRCCHTGVVQKAASVPTTRDHAIKESSSGHTHMCRLMSAPISMMCAPLAFFSAFAAFRGLFLVALPRGPWVEQWARLSTECAHTNSACDDRLPNTTTIGYHSKPLIIMILGPSLI